MSTAAMSLPLGVRLGSRLIGLYLRLAPLERGKTWLWRKTSSWLVARLDTGPWIRVSGVSGFEWSTLVGDEGSESATAAAYRSILRPGQCVIDAGANVGYYALTAAASVGPQGRVIAFEPDPGAAARLRENIALNGLTNLTVVEAAVSDRPGRMRMNLGGDSEASSLFDVGTEGRAFAEVPVVTLDDFLAGEEVAAPDVLKIDVEGAEVSLLRGARALLSSPDAPPIIVEANPITLAAAGESMASLRSELESLGYVVTTLESMPWRGEIVENWIARKPARRP